MSEDFLYIICDNQLSSSIDGFPQNRILFKFHNEEIAKNVYRVLCENFKTPFGFELSRKSLHDSILENKADEWICNFYELFGNTQRK